MTALLTCPYALLPFVPSHIVIAFRTPDLPENRHFPYPLRTGGRPGEGLVRTSQKAEARSQELGCERTAERAGERAATRAGARPRAKS
jgi:hypothetical protein